MNPAAVISPRKLVRRLPALLLAIFLVLAVATVAASAANDIVLSEVKLENVPFRKALSTIQTLLAEKQIETTMDPVHDIPANFDNPKTFSFAGKNVAVGDLLTSFCRYYGLDWKRSGDTVVLSLPRPRP